ncbi:MULTISPECIES: helix-turn-helix domain-containing protein [unclassified Serratia (in: enterobacteria)]|uniref:helix-turn-helix domain-containing protein n=1 Tax=unclassified Serratia (in: enterobacteria) TaxID=2647522 RepID=UPI0030764C08
MKSTFGERLSEAIRARGLSQADLSKKVGISNGYLSNVISGGISKPHKHIDAFANALGVRKDWLLNGNGNPDSDGEKIVRIPLYQYNKSTGKLSFIKESKIRFPEEFTNGKDLQGVMFENKLIFEGTSYVILDKTAKGSGMFLIEDRGELFISTRIDNISNIKWIHNSQVEIKSSDFNVLGKIISFFEFFSEE